MSFLALILAHLAHAVSACAARPALEIRSVHVVDVATGHIARDMTITVAAGRICEVKPDSEARSAAAHTINGRGRFLIPGLWWNAGALSEADYLLGFGITYLWQTANPTEDPLAALKRRSESPVSALALLQTLTVDAARRANVWWAGRIASGYDASLLLLEGNPLEDPLNLLRVSLVLRRGQPYRLIDLARLRAGRETGRQPFSY